MSTKSHYLALKTAKRSLKPALRALMCTIITSILTEPVDTVLGMVAKSEGKSKTQKANELLQKALGEEVIKKGMIVLQYANAKVLRQENPELARFAFLFAKYNRQKGRNISMFLPKNPPRQ